MIATSHSRISEYREENKNEGFPALNPKRNGLWSSLPSPLSHPSYRLYPYTLLRDNEQLYVGSTKIIWGRTQVRLLIILWSFFIGESNAHLNFYIHHKQNS